MRSRRFPREASALLTVQAYLRSLSRLRAAATASAAQARISFAFSGGKITHPVREMLMTGNFLSLWKNLVAVADDARPCLTRRIPTLAFKDVDIR